MNSLRLRLLAMAVIGIAAALVIAGVVIVLAFDNHVRGRFTKELDDHLLQVASLLVAEPEGKASLSGELSDPQFQRPLSGLYWQVSENGKAVARSPSLWDRFDPASQRRYRCERPAGARVARAEEQMADCGRTRGDNAGAGWPAHIPHRRGGRAVRGQRCPAGVRARPWLCRWRFWAASWCWRPGHR